MPEARVFHLSMKPNYVRHYLIGHLSHLVMLANTFYVPKYDSKFVIYVSAIQHCIYKMSSRPN